LSKSIGCNNKHDAKPEAAPDVNEAQGGTTIGDDDDDDDPFAIVPIAKPFFGGENDDSQESKLKSEFGLVTLKKVELCLNRVFP